MDELYQQIIDTYMETGSVKKTAESLNSYPIKVRRVLITEGLWHSKTSDQIAELSKQGLNVAEIAKKLIISEKNVQSYMPYSRGQYGGESRSNEAIRSEGYRDRMKKAAQNVKAVAVRAGMLMKDTKGENYVDTAVKILIAVVLGALLLAGLYALFGDVVMPTLTQRIQDMFNYAG